MVGAFRLGLMALGLLFLTLIVAKAPAGLIAAGLSHAGPGLSFSSVNGTLWQGTVSDVVVGQLPVGRVVYRLRPLSVLTLSPALNLTLSQGAIGGQIPVQLSRQQVRIGTGTLTVRLDAISQTRALGVPVTGAVKVAIDRLVFSPRDGCLDGALTLTTDFLKAPAARWGAQGFDMAGPGACEDGGLYVNLSGAGPDAQADLALTMRQDFSFAVDVAVKPGRGEVRQALELIGFQPAGGALTYSARGALRNVSL
ncbi:MAG: type II secretion system protein N [Pseudomonadota bacterium]